MDPAPVSRLQRLPLATAALLALLGAVFTLEQLFPVRPNTGWLRPDNATLIALGGLLRPLVFDEGEWYRLCSATLLHADLLHLGSNALSLVVGGALLERQLGKAWTVALFTSGAIAGSLCSLWMNAPETLSVGASGAIMSLLGAAFMMPGKLRLGPRSCLLLLMLAPPLVPLTGTGSAQNIDLASHLGGGMFGASIGLVWFAFSKRTAALAPLQRAAQALALLGVALFGLSAFHARAGYDRHALARFLIPESEVPRNVEDIYREAARLVQDYPRDPRSRLFRALAALDAKDTVRAERELRVALDDRPMLQSFSPEFEARVRTFLTQTLLSQGKAGEARVTAQPLCKQDPAAVPEAWRMQGLCPR